MLNEDSELLTHGHHDELYRIRERCTRTPKSLSRFLLGASFVIMAIGFNAFVTFHRSLLYCFSPLTLIFFKQQLFHDAKKAMVVGLELHHYQH